MREPAEAGEARPHFRMSQAKLDGERSGDGRVLQVVRPLQTRPPRLMPGPARHVGADGAALGPARRLARLDRAGRLVGASQHRELPLSLHRKKPRLGCRIVGKAIVAIEMVGRDVGERRRLAGQRAREVELVARQLQHIDPGPLRIGHQRLLREDRQADVPTHTRRHARVAEQVM